MTAGQLLDAGLSHDAVERRARSGLLHRVHRGVYRVGHRAPSTDASYLAAVLACGDGAALSGHAAAFQYGLIKGRPPPPEVTTTRDRRVRRVLTHRVRRLDPRDTTVLRGIPITTVARVLIDLAPSYDEEELGSVCHEAQVRYRVKARHVYDALARKPNAKGAAKLHAIFRGDSHILLSKLEGAFLSLLRSVGLPLPQTNRPAGAHYVDCRWREHRLTVELDSYTYHHTRHAWERDQQRKWAAHRRGDEFRRYSYDDVTKRGSLVLSDLEPLLTRPARPSP